MHDHWRLKGIKKTFLTTNRSEHERQNVEESKAESYEGDDTIDEEDGLPRRMRNDKSLNMTKTQASLGDYASTDRLFVATDSDEQLLLITIRDDLVTGIYKCLCV